MMALQAITFGVCVLASLCAADKENNEKTDLKGAESRVYPYGGLEPYGQNLGYGLEPYGLPYQRPIGLATGLPHDNGYLRSLNDGRFGREELFAAGNRFGDNSFHEGGLARDGSYHGLEGYRDNKHHVADDFANRGYYSGAHGVSKDLGNGEVFDKSHGFAQNAINTVGNSALAGHNKGHHKTGFRKSYHKDESGNDESYYDSDHNEGNLAHGKKFGDQYFTNGQSQLNGAHKLNEFEAQHGGHDGFDDTGRLLAVNQGVRDLYGKNGHYGTSYGSVGAGKLSNIDRFGLQNGRNLHDYRTSAYGPLIY